LRTHAELPHSVKGLNLIRSFLYCRDLIGINGLLLGQAPAAIKRIVHLPDRGLIMKILEIQIPVHGSGKKGNGA
jgi:hypothetical protein